MNYEIIEAKKSEKEKMYKLLQFALYDGSQYIDNDINENCIFEYNWFDNYFIKNNEKYLGIVLVNANLKFNKNGKSIAEFLIIPKYRRNHIGKKVAYDIFEKFKGNWEVQPMENNPIAYTFWHNIIAEYTNNNYIIRKVKEGDIFIFNNENN